MLFSLQTSPQEGVTWERWRRLVRAAEDLGFDSLRRADHYYSYFGDVRQESLETWVTLAVAAAETRRIRLGNLVCSVTFRHPALLARMAAQVDALSGGRLELGLGAGHYVREHQAFGIPFPAVAARMEMLEETCQVVRALWGPGPATFSGRHYQLRDAECYPKPAQERLPILIGGSGERRTLRIVAKHADAWNIMFAGPDAFCRKRDILLRHCAEVGRDPREIRSTLASGILLGRDRAELRRHAEGAIVANAFLPRDVDAALEELRRRAWLIGSPDEVLSGLRELEEAGVQEFMMQHKDSDNWELLELVGTAVLPHVKAARSPAA